MNRRILVALGGVALVFAACSSSGGSAPPASVTGTACAPATGSGTVAVSVKDFAFDPTAISAKVGDTVTFTNAGAAPHNATLDAGGCATPDIQAGSTGSLKFSAAGTYPFHCTIHPQMKGTITVGA
jgi:plastocyanin